MSSNIDSGINIKAILEDTNFVNLINEIMTSQVMENAYLRISISYLTNGKFDFNDKEITKSDIDNLKNSTYNLIYKISLFDC